MKLQDSIDEKAESNMLKRIKDIGDNIMWLIIPVITYVASGCVLNLFAPVKPEHSLVLGR